MVGVEIRGDQLLGIQGTIAIEGQSLSPTVGSVTVDAKLNKDGVEVLGVTELGVKLTLLN